MLIQLHKDLYSCIFSERMKFLVNALENWIQVRINSKEDFLRFRKPITSTGSIPFAFNSAMSIFESDKPVKKFD